MGRPDFQPPAQAFRAASSLADRAVTVITAGRTGLQRSLNGGPADVGGVPLPPARLLPLEIAFLFFCSTEFLRPSSHQPPPLARLGARFGLRLTLWAGLVLQIVALVDAGAWCQPSGPVLLGLRDAAQAISGNRQDSQQDERQSANQRWCPETPEDPGTTAAALFRRVADPHRLQECLKGVGFLPRRLLLTSNRLSPPRWRHGWRLAAHTCSAPWVCPRDRPHEAEAGLLEPLLHEAAGIQQVVAARLPFSLGCPRCLVRGGGWPVFLGRPPGLGVLGGGGFMGSG